MVFVIPDIVKGGTQPTAHRRVSIRACLDELYAAGVEKKDILLLFSNGLHPRATVPEMKKILGEDLFNEFYWSNQITSHDSEDPEHMVDLGTTQRGDPVLMNKYVFECDIPILIGHTQGNPYGGYSGGYKHCATGNRYTYRAEHRQPPRAQGDAPLRLHPRVRPLPHAHQVRRDRYANGGEDGATPSSAATRCWTPIPGRSPSTPATPR